MEKTQQRTDRNRSPLFRVVHHLNKNINPGANGLKDKIMSLKTKTEMEDLREQTKDPSHLITEPAPKSERKEAGRASECKLFMWLEVGDGVNAD